MITRTSTDLLEGIKDPSNRTAWAELDRRYRPLILAVARRLGLPDADAEDAAQETLAAFLEAYRQERYARDKGRLRDFLRGIACHKVRDVQRRAGRSPRPLQSEYRTAIIANIPDGHGETVWDQECAAAVLRQCLQEVRSEVSPRVFEAFELVGLQQWPARRVAQHLGISVDSVYQSKHRVLRRVRELLPEVDHIW
jgi:RNA polymerase sigma factor (sigma-70 family)